MTRLALALVVVLTLTAPTLDAQSLPISVPLGARARVTVPARVGRTTGTLVAADSAHIVLRVPPAGAHDTFLVAWVQTLEVSRGRPRGVRAGLGALIGAVVLGGITVGVLTRVMGDDEPGANPYAYAGVALGALLGAGIGAASAQERWEPVRLSPR